MIQYCTQRHKQRPLDDFTFWLWLWLSQLTKLNFALSRYFSRLQVHLMHYSALRFTQVVKYSSWKIPISKDTEHHLPYGNTDHLVQVNVPTLTPARQTGTWFNYPGGLKDRPDLKQAEFCDLSTKARLSKTNRNPKLDNIVPKTQLWLAK